MTLTEMNGGFSGSGNDSENGNFTILANVVANVFGGNITGPGSPVNNGAVFGYFDPQLGSKGSILLTSFQGGGADRQWIVPDSDSGSAVTPCIPPGHSCC